MKSNNAFVAIAFLLFLKHSYGALTIHSERLSLLTETKPLAHEIGLLTPKRAHSFCQLVLFLPYLNEPVSLIMLHIEDYRVKSD